MDSPIAFGTDGWRAELDTFTEERVRQVGQAVATYVSDHGLTGAPIAIGHDARQSSPRFARALSSVLRDNGIAVRRATRDLPTPVLAWTIAQRRYAGGLMVTASHNPPEYNGVKFITTAGAPALPSVTDALEARIADPRSLPPAAQASESPLAGLPGYVEHVLDLVGTTELQDLSVAYDAMHGSGRGVTDRVLEQTGISVTTYRCTRDPRFGGHGPEPAPDRLTTLRDAVERDGHDLGIANDGDADRIAVITPEHGFVPESVLFAALYDYLLESRSGPAVRSVSTSHLVDRVADAHGEDIVETPVGFKWIAKAMRESHALIGGEESGGFSLRGHVREKDGVLTALLVAAMTAAEPLDERIDRLLAAHGPIVGDKTAIECPDPEKRPTMDALEGVLPENLAGTTVDSVSRADGYKVTLSDHSWVLVRPSGTEPVLRVYAEASDADRVADLLDAGRDLVTTSRPTA